MKFKVGDFVEQKNLGDVPHIVLAVEVRRTFNRYIVESIDGTTYENIPEYLLEPARPAAQSKYGSGKDDPLCSAQNSAA